MLLCYVTTFYFIDSFICSFYYRSWIFWGAYNTIVHNKSSNLLFFPHVPNLLNPFIMNSCTCALSYRIYWKLVNHVTLFVKYPFLWWQVQELFAYPGPVLRNLTNQIRKAFREGQVFVQTLHTRDHFASELVPRKLHVDNDMCQHKLTAAVALYPRNTELQLTEDGAYQVAFEAEFDKPIGVTQFSHRAACHFHLVVTWNTDPNIKFEFIIVMGLVESSWLLDKRNGQFNTTLTKRKLSKQSVERTPYFP